MRTKEVIGAMTVLVAAGCCIYLYRQNKIGPKKVITKVAKSRSHIPVVVKTKTYHSILDVIFNTPEIETRICC